MSLSRPGRLVGTLLPFCIGPSLLAAIPGVPTRPFPLTQIADHGVLGLEFAPSGAALSDLALLTRVTLTGVPLPGGQPIEIDLERVVITTDTTDVRVDGVTQAPGGQPHVTLWSGHVAGDGASRVYLGFSPFGSRGFIRTSTHLYQLLAAPGSNGDWSATTSTLASNEFVVPPASAMLPDWCKTSPQSFVPPSARPFALQPPGGSGIIAATGVTPIFEAPIAVETDTQFFNLFGSLPAAQTYLLQLLGAVSDRYREQIGVIFTFPYLGYWTGPDPWVAQENGGGSVGLLYEFQAAWNNGGAPVNAPLYHFVSGAGLGGGVAWLPGLCDQTYGFGVSGNIGGNTPIPISVGPLNWDFVVIAHELGHNFGAPHTHDYCPPADECAPAGYFGGCQTQQVCTNQGTIMSYCHLCWLGFWNETTYFHPNSVSDMRNTVLASCLPYFEGFAKNVNLGFALAGSNGTPVLTANYVALLNYFALSISSAPKSKSGVLFLAPTTLYLPFFGGTLVPNTTVVIPVTTNSNGNVSLSAILPANTHIPGGATFFTQAWISDPGGPPAPYAATNGVEFEMILP